MDDMIRHSAAVRRGTPNCLHRWRHAIYELSAQCGDCHPQRRATSWLKQDAISIKLEGGVEMADRIHGIVNAGIPAGGHLGLTPQSASALGGHKVQGGKPNRPKRSSILPKHLSRRGLRHPP